MESEIVPSGYSNFHVAMSRWWRGFSQKSSLAFLLLPLRPTTAQDEEARFAVGAVRLTQVGADSRNVWFLHSSFILSALFPPPKISPPQNVQFI